MRLWNAARDAARHRRSITGNEVGLVAWWRMQDGIGNVASDSKGTQRRHPARRGVVGAHPRRPGSTLTIYLDGVPVPTTPSPPAPTAGRAAVHPRRARQPDRAEFFRGQLDELRVWRVTRTAEQIQDNLFRRLTGDSADLVAYYPFEAGRGM